MRKKTIYVKTSDNTIFSEIPDKEKELLLASTYEVFLDRGEGMPEISLSQDEKCFMITQDFAPMYLIRKADAANGKRIIH